MGISLKIAVVGGGIVGVCAAEALARAGHEVTLLERNARLFEEISTHNSGVIHAGLYYPEGSRKARTCVRGAALTYEFCVAHGVPHRRCGKLLLALSEEEVPALRSLIARAAANGAENVREVSPAEALELEPNIARPIAALFSPDSGVLDVGAYLQARERQALAAGATLLTHAEVTSIDFSDGNATLETTRGEMQADIVVGAGGLWSDELEARAGLPTIPVRLCRGEYYAVYGPRAALVSRLIYPVPGKTLAGLGVHLTPTPAGELLIGPNARWIKDKNDYETEREGPAAFLESVRRLLPSLEESDLRLGYTGIRPKLAGPEGPAADFEIAQLGPGGRFLSVRGIESPGLTAAPALAEEIAAIVHKIAV